MSTPSPNKPCIAVDTTVYDHPEAFGTISHMEGRSAIIARDDMPLCMCCNQPMPNITRVYR